MDAAAARPGRVRRSHERRCGGGHLAGHGDARAHRARRRDASAHAAGHLGRLTRARRGASAARVRTGRRAAPHNRRTGAPDDAADQADVVRAARPGDVRGCPLVGRPEGLPAAAADRRARHRAVLGLGHRPAGHGGARVEPRRDDGGRRSTPSSCRRSCPRPQRCRSRRRRRDGSACRRGRPWSSGPPTARWETSARARSRRASRGCRWARAAPSEWPSRTLTSTTSGRCSATP